MDKTTDKRLAELTAARDLAMREYFAAYDAGGSVEQEAHKLSEASRALDNYYLLVRRPTGLDIEF